MAIMIDTKDETLRKDGKADPKRRALGKGLESLLATRPPGQNPAGVRAETANPIKDPYAEFQTVSATEAGAHGTPRELAVGDIDPNPHQTRARIDDKQLQELAQSIAVSGVVQPILVRPLPNGRYQLIAGERRWRASEKAGKTMIPAILRQISDEQAMEITIVENLQRADLNPMEQARAFERLGRDFQMTQEQIAHRTGKDRASIGNFVRLLKLPVEVQAKVETGELSFGHARTLLALDSHEAMLKAMVKVLALGMSVRQTESYIQGLLNPEKKASRGDEKAKQVDPNVREAQESLQQRLGLKVRIEDKSGRGRVVIEYAGLEDFDALMSALGVGS
jgi:ParB family transcriptional regulator, chromosome partitioning protein